MKYSKIPKNIQDLILSKIDAALDSSDTVTVSINDEIKLNIKIEFTQQLIQISELIKNVQVSDDEDLPEGLID